MSGLDIIMLLVSFIVVGIVLAAGQNLHKKGYSPLFTRKLVHVAIGLWIIPSMFFFEHSWVAVIPPILAVLGNTVSYFTGMLGAIELKGEKPNFGTILFPASFIVIILFFFPDYNDFWYAGMLGALIMTFGDTAASVWGTYYGRSKYQVWDETRSIEGSLAMLLVSFIVSLIVFNMVTSLGVLDVSFWGNVILACYVATFSTVVEAVCLRGWDNFLVPVGTGFFTYWMLRLLLG